MKTTVDIDRDLLNDMKEFVTEQLRKGKDCGRLRINDSHESRIKYFFDYWKGEFVYGGANRKIAEKIFEKINKQDKLKDMITKMKEFVELEDVKD